MMKGQFLLGVSSIKPGTMNSFAQRQRRKILPRLLFKQQSSKKCNSLNNDVNERKDPENKPSVEMTKYQNMPRFSKSKCDNYLKETKKESYS